MPANLGSPLDVASSRGPSGTRVVAVDGRSGSGKTTFAEALAGELLRRTGVRPQVVHMDDIYPGWDGLAESVDLVVGWVLEPLSRGCDGRFRRWDWEAGRRCGEVVVPVADWVILEGVGSGSAACRPYLAAIVWLEVDFDVRRRRGLDRDGESFRPHWESWARQEDALFLGQSTKEHADLVVDTTDPRGRFSAG